MGDVKIRGMGAGHGPAVASLTCELGYEVSLRDVCERIGSIDNDNQAVAYVATIDGTVVGWIQAHDRRLLQYPRVLEIGGIAISEEHRAEGIGRRLMESVAAWGRARGHSWLFARSGAQRTGTHEFYESVGFEREKTSYTYSRSIG